MLEDQIGHSISNWCRGMGVGEKIRGERETDMVEESRVAPTLARESAESLPGREK